MHVFSAKDARLDFLRHVRVCDPADFSFVEDAVFEGPRESLKPSGEVARTEAWRRQFTDLEKSMQQSHRTTLGALAKGFLNLMVVLLSIGSFEP